MKFGVAFCAILLLASGRAQAAANEYRQLTEVKPLPMALDRDFEFRKTKLFLLGDAPGARRTTGLTGTAPRDPALGFENSYRLFGAVTELDKRSRYGHYFDFFWRAKRATPLTVRLEYQQEKLRAFTQAREITYANAKGSHKTSFAVTGDDFLTDGRILAWRCVLIVDGRVVAEDRSYLWWK